MVKDPLLTLSECVATHARLRPDKIGARDSKRALSYAAWDLRASRLANALLGLGLAKGDRVALLAHNAVEWLEIYVALARAGLVAVPINFRLVGPEIAYIVEDCEARAFIVHETMRPVIEGIRSALTLTCSSVPKRRRAGRATRR
jgi:fatty-acyl-CoA synthase